MSTTKLLGTQVIVLLCKRKNENCLMGVGFVTKTTGKYGMRYTAGMKTRVLFLYSII